MAGDPDAAGGVTVRPLTTGDLPDLMRLQSRNFPSELHEDEETIESLIAPGTRSFGAEVEGVLAGCILSCPGEDTPGTWYVYDIEVAPEFRGRGVASKLLERLLGETLRAGLAVELHCRAASHPIFSDAERMARYGYRIAFDRFLPGYYLECDLDEDAWLVRLEPLEALQ